MFLNGFLNRCKLSLLTAVTKLHFAFGQSLGSHTKSLQVFTTDTVDAGFNQPANNCLTATMRQTEIPILVVGVAHFKETSVEIKWGGGGRWLVDIVPPPVLQEIAHWTALFEEQNGALCWERILSEVLNKDTEIQQTMHLRKHWHLRTVCT